MLVALSGTPGTGKTSVSNLLKKKYPVFHTSEYKNYSNGLIFIEGHSSHLLKVDKVIILRCHPKYLKRRLESKGWSTKKIKENVEAEALDIILCEAAELYPEDSIFEIDTTHRKVEETLSCILEIVESNFKSKKYSIGKIDWLEEIFKEFREFKV
jgi:adenylate kinase